MIASKFGVLALGANKANFLPMDIPIPVAVKALPNYRLWLRYSDGTEGEVDFSHLTGKGVFNLWNDYHNFERVCISDAGAIAWSDVVEICPDAIYMRLTGKTIDEIFPELRQPLSHAGA